VSGSIKSLSIVIPAYNEAADIELVVRDALDAGAVETSILEVIVLDDGSTDDTGSILTRYAKTERRLRVLSHPENRGIEASLSALYAAARHDWIFANSADQQWPMSNLRAMTRAAAAGADLVVGVRANKRLVYGVSRRVLSLGYELVVRALGSPVGDPGSIKLGRRELFTVPVAAHGVFAEGERVIRAARGGFRVVGCPVEFRRRQRGTAHGARPSVIARAIVDAARVGASLYIRCSPMPSLPVRRRRRVHRHL
jgi:glycosyltransferase involved in cell wall biosynthesis